MPPALSPFLAMGATDRDRTRTTLTMMVTARSRTARADDGGCGRHRQIRREDPPRRVDPTVTNDDAGSRKPFATYPGSKDAGGVAEKIIGAFPPHSIYVEPFVGGGAVLRRKAPSLSSIAIDADADVAAAWRRVRWPGLTFIHGDGLAWLERDARDLPADALVYCDPPYPRSTRSRKRLYRYEWTDDDHRRFLRAVVDLPCSVAVSTYPNAMYAAALAKWRPIEFQAMTRGGVKRTEVLYVRAIAHGIGRDHRFAGNDFRQRERIKRKASRWVAKFVGMPDAERDAILAALLQHRRV